MARFPPIEKEGGEQGDTQTCCGKIPIVTGVKIIGAVSILKVIAWLIIAIIWANDMVLNLLLLGPILMMVFGILESILFIMWVCNDNPDTRKRLWISQIFAFCALITSFIYFLTKKAALEYWILFNPLGEEQKAAKAEEAGGKYGGPWLSPAAHGILMLIIDGAIFAYFLLVLKRFGASSNSE